MSWFFQLLPNCVRRIVMSIESESARPELSSEAAEQDHEVTSVVDCRATSSDTASIAGSHSTVSSHHSVHCTSDVSAVTSLKSVTSRPVGSHSSNSGEGSVGSGGGRETAITSLDMAEIDVLRFRNNFLQTVEELKMRREMDIKKENRLRELVEEKHQLQLKYDDIEQGYTEHVEQCSHHEQEIRKQFTSQLRQFEEDKARQMCLEESRHKEMKALKDEIRALQFAKYNLEKKVEDTERQLQVQTLSRESILSGMSGVEAKYQTVVGQVASTTEQMTLLEANVKEAVEMNRKLRYVNEHQKCLLAGCKAELETCRRELVRARASLLDRLGERGEREQDTSRRTTEQELKMHTELNKQLQVQLSSVREEHRAVLDRLREAHTLLDKHIQTSSTAQDSERMMREEMEKLRGTKERLESDLSAVEEQLVSRRQELSTSVEQWQAETEEVKQRLKSLQGDYSALQNAHDQLEIDAAARESELKSEIVRLQKREQDGEEERNKQERTVKELQMRVAELEQSLRERETHLQEKSFDDKEVQVSSENLEETSLKPCLVSEEVVTTHSKRQSPDSQATGAPVNTIPENSQRDSYTTDCIVGECITAVSSPLKLSFLSPEVISNPSSTSPPDDVQLKTLTLKLSSPILHLERIQLPLKSIEDKSSSHATEPVSTLSLKSASPLKRKFEEPTLPVTCTDPNLPPKKQKLPMPFPETNEQSATQTHDSASESHHPLDTQSERDITHPLSQPSCSRHSRDGADDRENQSLSQSSGVRYRKDNIPWRINLPESFYTNRRDPEKKSSTQVVHTSFPPKLSPSLPQTHYQAPWSVTKTPPEKASATTADNNVMRKSPIRDTPALPSPAKTATAVAGEVRVIPAAPPNTPLKIQPVSTSLPMQGGSHLTTTEEPTADQSVPRSPGGNGNFAIVFSEGEEEGEGKDELLSSQMNRQIKKVTTFLKMDRLRRTKVPKL